MPRRKSWKKMDQPEKRALVEDYDSTPPRDKKIWREVHGISDVMLSYYRKKFQRQDAATAVVVRRNGAPAPERSNEPRFTAVLPEAAPGPVGPTVTLEDAINAMQVRHELFEEFLDLLKRMNGSPQHAARK